MKIFFSFLFFVSISGLLLFLLTSNLESNVDPVSLLPPDTVSLLDLHNPAKSYARFEKLWLGQKVEALPWEEILSVSGLSEKQASTFMTRLPEMLAVLKSPLFREIFGRRALVAILPKPVDMNGRDETPDIKDQVLLICRPRHRASLLQLFSSLFHGRYDYTSSPFMGRSISRYGVEDRLPLYSVVTDGLVLIAFSEKPLKAAIVRSLQYMTGTRTGLDTDERYLNLKKRGKGLDDQFLFVDVQQIPAFLRDSAKILDSPGGQLINSDLLAALNSYTYFAFYRQPGKSRYKFNAILKVKRKDNAVSNAHVLTPPIQNTMLVQLPADLVLYFWTNTFNLSTLWNVIMLASGPPEAEFLSSVEQWIVSRTGLSRDRFLAQFGNQFSLNFAEVSTSGFFPLPRMCARLQLTDPAGAENAIMKLFEEFPIEMVMIGGHKVYSIMLADGLMKPSYSFVGNFLVIADSQEQIRHVLGKDKKLLIHDAAYKKVDTGLSKPSNVILYLKTDQLVSGMKEFLSLTGIVLSSGSWKNGAAAKVIVDKVFQPVLDGFTMIKAESVRVLNSESEIMVESSILLQ